MQLVLHPDHDRGNNSGLAIVRVCARRQPFVLSLKKDCVGPRSARNNSWVEFLIYTAFQENYHACSAGTGAGHVNGTADSGFLEPVKPTHAVTISRELLWKPNVM
jgi:hypothetical protein